MEAVRLVVAAHEFPGTHQRRHFGGSGQHRRNGSRILGGQSRWSLLPQIAEPSAVRPEQLFGLISGWFEGQVDETAHHASRKPSTISPLRPVAVRPHDYVAMDVGLLLGGPVALLHDNADTLAVEGGTAAWDG